MNPTPRLLALRTVTMSAGDGGLPLPLGGFPLSGFPLPLKANHQIPLPAAAKTKTSIATSQGRRLPGVPGAVAIAMGTSMEKSQLLFIVCRSAAGHSAADHFFSGPRPVVEAKRGRSTSVTGGLRSI